MHAARKGQRAGGVAFTESCSTLATEVRRVFLSFLMGMLARRSSWAREIELVDTCEIA
jgi:hypothetical protein